MNDPLRLAVVGAGIMGTNHARVARQLRGAELIAVVDSDLERAKAAASAAEARAVTDIEEIIGDIDAAIIAVPTPHHLKAALRQAQAGVNKHD